MKLAVIVSKFQTYSIKEHFEVLIKESLKIADKILFIIECVFLDPNLNNYIITDENDFGILFGIDEVNPLNFDSRRVMILQYFSEENLLDRLYLISPIYDACSNEILFYNLDQLILSKISNLDIYADDLVLICFRDSFLKTYSGKFNLLFLKHEDTLNSSEIMKNIPDNFEDKSFQIGFRISKDLRNFYQLILADEESRRGYIYGIYHKRLIIK